MFLQTFRRPDLEAEHVRIRPFRQEVKRKAILNEAIKENFRMRGQESILGGSTEASVPALPPSGLHRPSRLVTANKCTKQGTHGNLGIVSR